MTNQEMADNFRKMLLELKAQLDGEEPTTKQDVEVKVVNLCYTMLGDICGLYEDIHEDLEIDCVNEERMKLLKRITSIYTQLFGSFR